ncbi:hypothetical protein [Roseateles sp.]|jgi:hypothetical protein
MSEATPQTVIPQLRITQAARSLAFYVDGLGFEIDGSISSSPATRCSCS